MTTIRGITTADTTPDPDTVLIEGDDTAETLPDGSRKITINDAVNASDLHGVAIKTDTAGQIAALTLKATPVAADMVIIEDSAAGNVKKRATWPSGATDTNAIHDNVAAEISAITAKGTPVGGDFFVIEDSAASDAKKSVTLTALQDALVITESQISDLTHTAAGGAGTDTTAIHDNVASEISAVTEKGSPVGGDFLLIEDSADSNAKKRIQITNLPTIAGTATKLEMDAQKASAGTLNIGEVAYITGWDNGAGVAECELADADAAATMPSIGIVSAAMTNSSTGQLVVNGNISGLDTSTFTAGDALYVSGTAGGITATKPTGTALIQKLGICMRSHASAGIICVVGAGRSNDLPNLPNGEVWMGDGSGVPQETLVSALTAATATAAGVIKLATQAEVDAGSDASRAVTPATLTAKPLAGLKLTENTLLIGNVSNNAIEVAGGGAAVAMQPPWFHSTTTDPGPTDDYAIGWRWLNTTNGKLWTCLVKSATVAVWRCSNVVVEDNTSTTAVEADNTWDGSIKRFTGASGGLNVEMPASLNNGLSFEIVQWNANDPVTVILKAASGVTINTHADFNPTTNGQFSSIVVTVMDANDVLVRAGGPDPV